jgi:TusA-related sulfurtransferase
MKTIDLRNQKCPMTLVILRRFLWLQNSTSKQPIMDQLCLLFSTQQAMQDIILYLDKKGYYYSTSVFENKISLLIKLK